MSTTPPSPSPAKATPSRAPMLTLDEALSRLLSAVRPLPATDAQRVSTFDALGRVLAEDVRSALDVPPADNTAMDGYALRCADVPAAGTVLPVSQRIPAGVVGAVLQPGTVARIFTGAQVPAGADAVVMQEQCEPVADAAVASVRDAVATTAESAAPGSAPLTHVRINTVAQPGQWIRRRGEDVQHGAVVLTAGTRLTPQALGMAASVGAATLVVAARPRVALFSTGDELAMPGDPLKPGAIYNSNRFTLRALIQALGCECTDLGIVPDRLDATREALRHAAQGNHLIVTSGGVSVGEEDHLRPAVAAEGRIDLWQIAIKPGKPLAFGEVRRPDATSAWFIGLPGNPVSSFITFLLAVRPVLMRLQGATDAGPAGMPMRADFDWPRPDKRREFLRVRRNDRGGLDLFPNQSSGVLTSTVWGDGVVDNPSGCAIRPGDTVRYLSFAEWLA
ncbi:MAG: molybdenum cofactor biosynthesis protein MoaA [Methylibium sp. NZG]|nr:MAG: molybdenum cofactor biosynthesis protein MoaA [Methylibium sp. NZG]